MTTILLPFCHQGSHLPRTKTFTENWDSKHHLQELSWLERTYKPHYHYQNFSPLANGTDLNREKYAVLQTHWH